MKSSHPFWQFGTIALLWLTATSKLSAQIIPDTTLPNNSVVLPSSNTFQIEGGTKAGSNLFHSFKEFFILTGGEAFFNNAADIQNIFSRVTGGKISNIDGLIRANGTANLFLINPNGIIFGPNARLNIGGSFLASTASSIRFPDGREFSAINPQTSSLLTINVPIGLQYGQAPGNIVGQAALEVQPGQTLGLIGGNVILEGGQLRSPQGRIELASVGPNSLVNLTPTNNGFVLGYEGVQNFQDIQLSKQAVVDASGIGGGAVQIQGNRLSVRDGSQILSMTQGSQPGGNLTIRTADAVEIAGATPTPSRISTQTLGAGNGGNLTIETGQLFVRDGAVISTETEGSGNGGSLTVRAGFVEVSGSNPLNFTRLSSDTTGTGTGGNLSVETQQFLLQGTAFLSTTTFGTGTGGNLRVQASDSVVMVGIGLESLQRIFAGAFLGQLRPTDRIGGLFAGTAGLAASGEIDITTHSMLLQNGAVIFNPTFGKASTRDIRIRAANSVDAVGSAIIGISTLGSSGAAGNVTIDTGKLLLVDGTVVSSGTFGTGSGGDVVVNASESVEVSRSIPGTVLPTGILNSTVFGTGAGGDIRITTGRLINRDGGLIVANSGGRPSLGVIPLGGPGGDIFIEARESVEISGVSPDGQNTSGPGTTTFTAFPAGNLTISTGKLVIADGAIVSSATLSSGHGGTLTVNASDLVELKGKSSITGLPTTLVTSSGRVDAPEAIALGAGGDLRINTGRLVVQDGATLDVSSFGVGSAGTLEVVADSIRLDRGGTLNAATARGAGGNIQVRSQTLELRRGSNITTNASNTDGGNITINTNTLVALENSDITANAQAGRGGQVIINAQAIFGATLRDRPTPESDITATSNLGSQFNGIVQINTLNLNPTSGLAQLPQNFTDPSNQIARGCAADTGSRFVVSGRRGIPADPSEPLPGSAVWRDVRPVMAGEQVGRGAGGQVSRWAGGQVGRWAGGQVSRESNSPVTSNTSPLTEIVEATGWVMNTKGEVELVANAFNDTPSQPWNRAADCGNR